MNRAFLLIIMFVASCYANAQVVRTVELTNEDDLAAVLGEDRYLIDSIAVNGYLSHDNVKILCDCVDKGTLQKLDMSGCVIENDSIPSFGFRGETYNRHTLVNVRLPRNLRAIGRMAFESAGFKSIDFPSTLRLIDDEAFANSKKLESIIIPEGVTEIGKYAFSELPNVRKIQLPASLKKINEAAFIHCGTAEGITTDLILSEGLEYIGLCAFGDNSVKELKIPSTVVEIGNEAFSFCENLESLQLPEGLTKICRGAFWHNKLREIVLPATLQSMEGNPFLSEISLERVYAKGIVPPEMTHLISNSGNFSPYTILYVPVGTKDAYSSSSFGKCFNEIRETENFPTSIDGVEVKDATYGVHGGYGTINIKNNGKDAAPYHVYTPDGKLYNKDIAARGTTVVNADRGVYIVKIGKSISRIVVK